MNNNEYRVGVNRGLPVGMGYFSVSFGFGAMAVSQGVKTLDAVLIAWPPGQPSDPALDAVPVFCEELLLALPADHAPISGPQEVQPGTLAAFERGCSYRHIAQQWLAARTPPLQWLELGSYHAILACVAAGNCVGVVPRSVLELARTPPALHLHPLQSVDTLLVRRAGYRSAALDALQQALLVNNVST